jgi:hypothetical protein
MWYICSVQNDLEGFVIPNGTQSRVTGRARQTRARRRPSRASVPVFRTDLAERLRPSQAALRRKLGARDVLAEMIRAVNSTLDPERVADTLVQKVAEWVPAPCWLVLAVDDAGRVRSLASRAVTPTLTDPAQAGGRVDSAEGRHFRERQPVEIAGSPSIARRRGRRCSAFRSRAAARRSAPSWRWIVHRRPASRRWRRDAVEVHDDA